MQSTQPKVHRHSSAGRQALRLRKASPYESTACKPPLHNIPGRSLRSFRWRRRALFTQASGPSMIAQGLPRVAVQSRQPRRLKCSGSARNRSARSHRSGSNGSSSRGATELDSAQRFLIEFQLKTKQLLGDLEKKVFGQPPV